MATWYVKHFDELTVDQLYDILKLRVDVFVVEQRCYYPDIDDLDRDAQTKHLFYYIDGKIAAYLRVLAMGTTYADCISLGRIVVAPEFRGRGVGNQLLQEGLKICLQQFKGQPLKISAQQHLEKFYTAHHFMTVSDCYLEDNIPHIAMLYQQVK
ncbi:GNAT family N-acetyltransferase [Psychromonas sp. MME2]|uniref:GNAT family N-acetyltransferase n=1 Tax=unclassified Psychromonas TaxID=2614957 RepID=UPI00339C042B